MNLQAKDGYDRNIDTGDIVAYNYSGQVKFGEVKSTGRYKRTKFIKAEVYLLNVNMERTGHISKVKDCRYMTIIRKNEQV